MSELALGGGTDVLRTTLGSCVGIAFMWRKAGRCALAHCLLPQSPASISSIGAKYVTQAIPSLLSLLRAQNEDLSNIDAVLVGGANMMVLPHRPNHPTIGEQNAQVATRLIAELGINVVHKDVGGEMGRQLRIDCASYEYTVRHINRPTGLG
jgi:chemotaxis protein CheD